jgi:aldehyde:ferredoxin oxidoreductase
MATTSFGWTGRVLQVDLTTGQTSIEDGLEQAGCYLGGRGFGQRLIFDQVPPSAGALDEENVLVFSAGPLVGTLAPASARLSVESKNAVTGGVGSANAGGHFAPELKYAGFDAVIIRGASPRPVYLLVRDGEACLVPAEGLWGQGVIATEQAIRSELSDARACVAAIGPAGETKGRAGCIIVDGARAAGRGALGAVMGAKNLKALAVRGRGGVRVRHPERFAREVAVLWRRLNDNPAVETLRRWGTPSSVEGANELCRLPVRNFQDDHWAEERRLAVSPVAMQPYQVRRLACFNCPLYCSAFLRVARGEFAGTACEGFQANLVWNFLAKLDVFEPAAAVAFQATCSDLGLDIDNASGVIAWAIECRENGILSAAEVDNLDLRWGNYGAVLTLLRRIARREGVGDLLARGVREASALVGRGSERFAIHVKGQEMVEGIRAAKGWALGTVVAPRGGGHLDGAMLTEAWHLTPAESVAWFGTPTASDPTTFQGKAAVVTWYEAFKKTVDATGICYFATKWRHKDLLGPEEIAALFSAATGHEMSAEELMLTGRRIHNLEKAFNTLHAGFGRSDDLPSPRLMAEPVASGRFAGAGLDRGQWELALDDYYTRHGWDAASGWQTRTGLEALGMADVAERLAAAGRLVEG